MKMEEATAGAEGVAILCFRLRGRWFGLDACMAQEVVEVPVVTPLPGSPPHVRGLFPLHGRAIPLVELGLVLGLPAGIAEAAESNDSEDTALVIVASAADMTVGILADKVREIVEIPAREICELRISTGGRVCEFGRGEIDLGEKVVTVLDLKKLLEATRV